MIWLASSHHELEVDFPCCSHEQYWDILRQDPLKFYWTCMVHHTFIACLAWQWFLQQWWHGFKLALSRCFIWFSCPDQLVNFIQLPVASSFPCFLFLLLVDFDAFWSCCATLSRQIASLCWKSGHNSRLGRCPCRTRQGVFSFASPVMSMVFGSPSGWKAQLLRLLT